MMGLLLYIIDTWLITLALVAIEDKQITVRDLIVTLLLGWLLWWMVIIVSVPKPDLDKIIWPRRKEE